MMGRIHRTLLASLLVSGIALALPENGQVMQGNLQISQPQSHILQILQSSPTGIINWGSFNVDANQLVQFLQPGASSALLNRVIGQDPSQILGQIQANGRIFLVNPNGILFGPGSSVNAGSFMATTLSIQDQDFIQGRYNFYQDPNSALRAVVNQGEIHVTDGGFIALVSPLVDNQGLLVAQQGQVVLGATTRATLQVDARGLLQVSIPDGFRGQSGSTPQTVLLTQGQMSDSLAQLVGTGPSQGERIIQTAQGIQLVGAEGVLVNQGTVRADGGSVLMDSSQATVNTGGSLVTADAGEIRVLSRGSAVQTGELSVASATGNGGFIEVSGHTVQLSRAPDLAAPQGKAGHLLIDPDIVHIVDGTGDNPTFPVLAGDAPSTRFINASALDTAGTVTVQAQTDLFIDPNVAVVLTQATDLTLQAVDGNLQMEAGSSISTSNPATTVTLLAGTNANVHDILAPNITVTAGDTANLTAGQFGNPTLATVMSVNAPHILVGRFPDTTPINVVGTSANVSLNATGDTVFASGSKFNIDSPTAYLNARGDNQGVTVLQNTSVNVSGTGNLTLQANNAGGVFLRENSLVRMGGAGNITLDTTGDIFSVGAIQAENTASVFSANAGTGMQISTVDVPTMDFTSPSFVKFLTGSLGVSATDTVLHVTSPSISFENNSEVHVLGNRSEVTLTSTGDWALFQGANVQLDNNVANLTMTSPNGGLFSDNASLRVNGAANVTINSGGAVRMFNGSQLATTGLGNISIQADALGMDTGSLISLADPASRLSAATIHDLTTASVDVPKIDLHAGGTQFFNPGTLGRAGGATVLNAASDHDLFYFSGGAIRFVGNTVNYNQTAVGNVFFAVGANVSLDAATSNNVSLTSTGFMQTGTDTPVTISGTAPTRLQLTAGSFGLDNSRIQLPDSASNVSIQSTGVVRINDVTTGSFNITTTAGNVRVLGQIEANDLTINTPRELIRTSSSAAPALIAHHSLNLTADRISGPVNISEVGLVQGFPIATDGTTLVRINVTGTNSTDQGNRAANIFYYFPQSGDVQVTNPNGDVLVYNQPNPNPAPPAPTARTIQSREDFTPAQFAEITGQAAQAQIQLSNLYSAAYLPSTSSVLMLGYNNIGLTHFAPVPLSTPLLELAVLSPADSSETRARSQSSQGTSARVEGTTGSGTTNGTTPRVEGTGTTTSTSTSSTSNSGTTNDLPGRGTTPTVETSVLSPESSATGTRNRDNAVRDDQANSMVLSGNDEDEELRYWRRLIEGFIIWEE